MVTYIRRLQRLLDDYLQERGKSDEALKGIPAMAEVVLHGNESQLSVCMCTRDTDRKCSYSWRECNDLERGFHGEEHSENEIDPIDDLDPLSGITLSLQMRHDVIMM